MATTPNRTDKVLVVDDDARIRDLLRRYLTQEGFEVMVAEDGKALNRLLLRETVDIIVLDLMMPGEDGLSICRRLRAANDRTPIIMLTAKGEEDDIVTGLDSGADDYVTKPFSPRVLIARIEAALRRKTEAAQPDEGQVSIFTRHSLEIHPGRHEVRVAGQEVQLTASEFTILELLASRPGWVFSRQQIIDQIRGYDYSITPRAVDVQIFGLRKKLGSSGTCIETVRGIGYRLRD